VRVLCPTAQVLGRVPVRFVKRSRFASRYFNDSHQFVSPTTHRVVTQATRGQDLQSLLLRAAAQGGLDPTPRQLAKRKAAGARGHGGGGGGGGRSKPRRSRALSAAERSEVLRLKDLLQRCLVWDPARRLTAEQALRHSFFKQHKTG